MPYYRRYRKPATATRKRYWRRAKKLKYKKRFAKASIKQLKRGTIIPDRYFCRLKFNQTLDYRPTVANPTSRQLWRGNSAYDPDQTGLGGQPLGFDQIMALYDNYRIYASSIKIQIMPLSTGSGNFIKWSLYPSNTPSNDVSPDIGAEHPYAKSDFSASANQNFRTIRNFMSTKRILGYKNIMTNDNFIGTAGTNPTSQWYWILDYLTVGGVNNIDPGYLNVTITYYCEFFNRKDLAQS